MTPLDNPAAWDEVRALSIEDAATVIAEVQDWRDSGPWPAAVFVKWAELEAEGLW